MGFRSYYGHFVSLQRSIDITIDYQARLTKVHRPKGVRFARFGVFAPDNGAA
jgi:hypothetical protein